MQFNRKQIERIIREEIARAMRIVREADEEKKDDEKEKDEPKADKPAPKKGPPEKKAAPKKDIPAGPPASADGPPPGGEEPGDAEIPDLGDEPGPGGEELPADPAAEEEPEDAEGPPQGLAAELTGKTVQSVAFEPDSRLMPGASEVIISFDEMPEPMRILIGKSGLVRFYYKGLHNRL